MAIKNIGIGGVKKPLVPQLDAEIAAKKNRVNAVTPAIAPAVAPAVTPVVRPPVMPPNVTPVTQGMTDAEKAAEANFRKPGDGGLIGQEAPVDAAVAPAIDTEATKKALRDRQRQLLIDRFQSNLAGTTSEIDAARAGIDPKFRGLTSGVQTQDTMNRERARKLATGFGPSGSGFLGQSGIAQNVVTGGRLGQLDVQRSAEEAALDRQQIEAQRVADLGQAEAEAGFDIADLTSQLQSEEAQIEFERSRAELQESREYDDYLRQVEKADEAELMQEENRLLQENKLLDAEIDEALSVNDFAREKELAGQKAWIATQLEGLKQSGRIALEGERGVQDRLTDAADEEAGVEKPLFPTSVLKSSISNAVANAKDAFAQQVGNRTDEFGNILPKINFSKQDEQNVIKKFLIDNVDDITEQQGLELMKTYNIDATELSNMLEGALSPGGN